MAWIVSWTARRIPTGYFQSSMCIYLRRLHICSSFPWSSPDFWILLECEIREKRATCVINQLDGKQYIFNSCPYLFPFKDMFRGLCKHVLSAMTSYHVTGNVAWLHQVTNSEYFVIGYLLEKKIFFSSPSSFIRAVAKKRRHLVRKSREGLNPHSGL